MVPALADAVLTTEPQGKPTTFVMTIFKCLYKWNDYWVLPLCEIIYHIIRRVYAPWFLSCHKKDLE